jgi:hypothetical protein
VPPKTFPAANVPKPDNEKADSSPFAQAGRLKQIEKKKLNSLLYGNWKGERMNSI